MNDLPPLYVYIPSYLQQGVCQYTRKHYGGTMTAYVAIQSGNEHDLMSAVARIGPIAVAVDASSKSFRVRMIRTYS